MIKEKNILNETIKIFETLEELKAYYKGREIASSEKVRVVAIEIEEEEHIINMLVKDLDNNKRVLMYTLEVHFKLHIGR